MRVLLTGAAGFVGGYVAQALEEVDPSAVVVATSRTGSEALHLRTLDRLDITSPHDVSAALARYRPTHIINLAGIAAPQLANADSGQTWRIHLDGVLILAHAIMNMCPNCVLVNAGSGLIYGATANKVSFLTEDALLDPQDEYGATKAAADLALGAISRKGLKCIRMRPFNHTGPRQTIDFAVPAFAMQIARIEAGLSASTVSVGNLDAERDFLDVRDVARSYALAVVHSAQIPSGAIFNIASGVPRRMRDVLDRMIAASDRKIEVELDPARLRPSDVPRLVGDATRAKRMLGWEPRYQFDETLQTVLEDCRRRVAAGG